MSLVLMKGQMILERGSEILNCHGLGEWVSECQASEWLAVEVLWMNSVAFDGRGYCVDCLKWRKWKVMQTCGLGFNVRHRQKWFEQIYSFCSLWYKECMTRQIKNAWIPMRFNRTGAVSHNNKDHRMTHEHVHSNLIEVRNTTKQCWWWN